MSISALKKKPPVIIGEVLFDEFEDGSAVLGGAPFNVAWHLHGFGAQPLFISRVGDDEPGARILSTMQAWDMDIRGMQQDDVYATGTVKVKLSDGQPDFDIVSDVAYDHIALEASNALLTTTRPAMLYHGSLVARTRNSRQVLSSLINTADAPVFMDINLRPPHWSYEMLTSLIHGANWLKLNDQELSELSSNEGIVHDDLQKAAELFRQSYTLDSVIVTQGAEGAFIATSEGMHTVAPVKVENLVDTVGAGDAFSAIIMLGILNHWEVELMLQRAVQFAAAVCEQRGATRQDAGFYQGFMQDWGL